MRVPLAIFGFLGAFGTGIAVREYRDSRVVQPIRMNHRIHIENDMKCVDCHLNVDSGAMATIPNTNTCAECHGEPMGKSAEEKRVVALVGKSENIPWRRVNAIPDHVYFSHRRHVTLAKMDCKVCHGDMAHRQTPPERPFVVMDMDRCVECHEKKKASEDCNACHR